MWECSKNDKHVAKSKSINKLHFAPGAYQKEMNGRSACKLSLVKVRGEVWKGKVPSEIGNKRPTKGS